MMTPIDAALARLSHYGWRLESYSPQSCAVSRGKKTNHALHAIISFLTFWLAGGWLWVWLALAASPSYQTGTVYVSGDGSVLFNTGGRTYTV